MSDTQMVLPTEKVMYQAQEVAAVIATDRYAAADGVEAVDVEYEPLPVVVDPYKALEPGAPVLRTDKPGKKDNHIWHWEAGDRAATDAGLQGRRRQRQSSTSTSRASTSRRSRRVAASPRSTRRRAS